MGSSSKTFGEEIRRLRDLAGVSQGQLAKRLGITQGSLSHIERGRRTGHDAPLVNRICTELGVPLDHFAEWISPGVQVPPPPGQPGLHPVELGKAVSVPIIGVIGAGPAIDDPAEPG